MGPVPAEASGAEARTVQVELVYCAGPHQLQQVPLHLTLGSTVGDALAASGLGLEARQPASSVADGLHVGVWGKAREPSHVLREGDRVEVYRRLLVDPKEARRLRYAQHKAKLASMGPPRLVHQKTG
jgi:uncharacterized protein